MVAGTPAWLAPEQFLGKEITTSVDNFAAGSTLMFAATGKTPWGADDSSVGAVMHTILMAEPDTSTLTDFQIDIITPLLIKDAQLRKTAAQMLKKLNDGPRKLTLGSKKEQKQQEASTREINQRVENGARDTQAVTDSVDTVRHGSVRTGEV
jgi:serine/threonine protein kinase